MPRPAPPRPAGVGDQGGADNLDAVAARGSRSAGTRTWVIPHERQHARRARHHRSGDPARQRTRRPRACPPAADHTGASRAAHPAVGQVRFEVGNLAAVEDHDSGPCASPEHRWERTASRRAISCWSLPDPGPPVNRRASVGRPRPTSAAGCLPRPEPPAQAPVTAVSSTTPTSPASTPSPPSMSPTTPRIPIESVAQQCGS